MQISLTFKIHSDKVEFKSEYRTLLFQILFKNRKQQLLDFIKDVETKGRDHDLSLFLIETVYNELMNDESLQEAHSILNELEEIAKKINGYTLKAIIETKESQFYSLNECISIGEIKYFISRALHDKILKSANIERFEKIFEKLKEIIETTNLKQLNDYAFNTLVSQNGFNILSKVTKNKYLKWIVEDFENQMANDPYLVLGENYEQIKTIVHQIWIGNEDQTQKLYEMVKINSHSIPFLYLALFQEITFLYTNSITVDTTVFENVMIKMQQPKEVWIPLLRNSFIHKLTVNSSVFESDPYAKSIQSVLIQFKYFILHSHHPLVEFYQDFLNDNLKKRPHYYLPTMPDNVLFDMIKQRTLVNNADNPTFYMCSNGHIYLITNVNNILVFIFYR